jgi:hypothetical protein
MTIQTVLPLGIIQLHLALKLNRLPESKKSKSNSATNAAGKSHQIKEIWFESWVHLLPLGYAINAD